MSVTELRQRIEDYWGQGGILGAIIDEERDLYRIVRDGSRLNPAVLSHWVNRECNQWLSYFIAKNHTLGAVHAWYTAFIGVTRECLDNLREVFTNIARYQDLESVEYMESVYHIKTRMSFEVCMEGHNEVVDGLPSLPFNSETTTNARGMQIISKNIKNLPSWRI